MTVTQFIAAILYEAMMVKCVEAFDHDDGRLMRATEDVRWGLLDIVDGV